jgi:hypothetical protein
MKCSLLFQLTRRKQIERGAPALASLFPVAGLRLLLQPAWQRHFRAFASVERATHPNPEASQLWNYNPLVL